MKTERKEYQPKTGTRCTCRRGVERDNCSACEGTGWVIDFRAVHARREASKAATESDKKGGTGDA